MRMVLAIAALLIATFSTQASVTTSPTPASSSTEQVDFTRKAIRRAYDHVQGNNIPDAIVALNDAIQSDGFEYLPGNTRYAVLVLAAHANTENGDHAAAHAQWVRASELTQANRNTWHSRLAAAFRNRDYPDSAHCVTTIARRWPKTLNKIRDQGIYRIETELGKDAAQADARQALLESLFNANWSDIDGVANRFWRDLAQILLAKDDVQQADAVAARIRSARIAITMRIDKSFDRITQGNPDRYDINRLAADELAAARVAVESTPGQLRLWVRLQQLLLDTLQHEQALAIADDIIAKAKDGDGKSIYEDFDDYYIWVLNQRAEALARLGRWDEVIEQLSRATRRPENGGMNVSQILNLGWYYAFLEQPAKALDTVSELGEMSPYGRMQLEMVRLMAALQQKDEAAVATHLTYMREHRADAINTWQNALLFSGDLDAAGDLLVERLNSEQWRGDALASMQGYADVPRTPMEAVRLRRWRELLAQPKVIQALSEVGRIENFDLAG